MKEQIKAALANLEPQLKRVSKLIHDAENDAIYSSEEPEELYLRNMFYRVGEDLDKARRYIRQVSARISSEGTISKLSDGRYGNERVYYTSGSSIEFLYSDPDGDDRWIYSSVEHNGVDYYIVVKPELSLNGLRVRVKDLPFWD
ncbi:DUF5348 domain-containing protein [Paenibacillus sp. NPDC057934]|uniref:DUF5348 domain-containing protein n=1 Tax=Paenibacillus sp. NPDC057934 TaxID=3346282 RepID=UPI0036D96BBA